MRRQVYKELAALVGARKRCIQSGNSEWKDKHEDTINAILKHAPHGSGFDSGTTLDLGRSTEEKLVLHAPFHHMNENGMYDGWEEYDFIVTPSLSLDFHIRITGRDRNGFKEYAHETFEYFLSRWWDIQNETITDEWPDAPTAPTAATGDPPCQEQTANGSTSTAG